MRKPDTWRDAGISPLAEIRNRLWAASAGQLGASAEELVEELRRAYSRPAAGAVPRWTDLDTLDYCSRDTWLVQAEIHIGLSRPEPPEADFEKALLALWTSVHYDLSSIREPAGPMGPGTSGAIEWRRILDVWELFSGKQQALAGLAEEVGWAKGRLEYAAIDPENETERYNSLAHVRRVIRERMWPICESTFPERVELLVVLIGAIARSAAKYVTNDDLSELSRAIGRVADSDFDDAYVAETDSRLREFGVGPE